MNYRFSTNMQWLLILTAGVVTLKLGKMYGKQQADVMNFEYQDATTRKDIAKAINAHNEEDE